MPQTWSVIRKLEKKIFVYSMCCKIVSCQKWRVNSRYKKGKLSLWLEVYYWLWRLSKGCDARYGNSNNKGCLGRPEASWERKLRSCPSSFLSPLPLLPFAFLFLLLSLLLLLLIFWDSSSGCFQTWDSPASCFWMLKLTGMSHCALLWSSSSRGVDPGAEVCRERATHSFSC